MMLKWLKKLRTKAQSYLGQQRFHASDLDLFLAESFAKTEEFINTSPDLTQLPIQEPVRLLWNQTAYHLAEYYRDAGNFEKARHFYQLISPDAPQAPTAYFHLGNLYLNLFGNSYEATHYLKLAAERGDEDAALLLPIPLSHIEKKAFYTRQRYYSKLRIQTPKHTIPSFLTLQQIYTHRQHLQHKSKEQSMLNSQPNLQAGIVEEKPEITPEISVTSNEEVKAPSLPTPVLAREEKLPAHLLAFRHQCDPAHYPTNVSPFYQAVKKAVAECKEDLKKDKPWFFKAVWETRFKDVTELEQELEGIAKSHFNDQRLFYLCQNIINQDLPFLFNRNALLKRLENLLMQVSLGHLQINLIGTVSYQTLQEKYSATTLALQKAQEDQKKQEFDFKQYIEASKKEVAEERAARDKAFNEKMAARQAEIEKITYDKKAITEENLRLTREIITHKNTAEQHQKKAKLYEQYVAVKNTTHEPTLFKKAHALPSEPRQKAQEIPELLCCCISKVLMEDPVVAEDGYAYERNQIETWFTIRPSSPMTAKPIGTKLVPCYALRDLISDWLQTNQPENNINAVKETASINTPMLT